MAEYTSPSEPLNWSTFSQLRVVPVRPRLRLRAQLELQLVERHDAPALALQDDDLGLHGRHKFFEVAFGQRQHFGGQLQRLVERVHLGDAVLQSRQSY